MHEGDGRLTPPQGGEPERRRGKRRTRRQAGVSENRARGRCIHRSPFGRRPADAPSAVPGSRTRDPEKSATAMKLTVEPTGVS
jgi:hypothetical protein